MIIGLIISIITICICTVIIMYFYDILLTQSVCNVTKYRPICLRMLYLENKGVVFIRAVVCTAQYKHGHDHYLSGMTRA